MIDFSIVTETSQEANWNGQANRQADEQDHVLSQADALTKKDTGFISYLTCKSNFIGRKIHILEARLNCHFLNPSVFRWPRRKVLEAKEAPETLTKIFAFDIRKSQEV